jgi:hypothetical protein
MTLPRAILFYSNPEFTELVDAIAITPTEDGLF